MLDKIKQTSRTILFEEINPEKNSLNRFMLIDGNIDRLNQDINKELAVSSFDEFLEKFEPALYQIDFRLNGDVEYSLTKPEGMSSESLEEITIKFKRETPILKMLLSLVKNKKDSGEKIVDFDYKDWLNILSPKKNYEELKKLRNDIIFLDQKHKETKDLNIGKQLNEELKKLRTIYNNPIDAIIIAAEDKKKVIDSHEKRFGSLTSGNDTKMLNSKFIIDLDEDGTLVEREIKMISSGKQETQNKLTVVENKLTEIIEKDYNKKAIYKSEAILEIIKNIISPKEIDIEKIDIEKEKNNYTKAMKIYENNLKSFISVAKPLIQKIIGVYLFFEQSEVRGIKRELLITNNTLSDSSKEDNLKKLKIYFEFTNNTITKDGLSNTFWFGIVPNINFDKNIESNNDDDDILGLNSEIDNKSDNKIEFNKYNDFKSLMGLLKEYRIQTFFDFYANEKTTFSHIASKGISYFIEKTEDLVPEECKDFAIPCVPNFTIIPEDKIKSKVDITENDSVDIGGFYVNSSYIAAGITVAYQNPLYLEKIFGKESTADNLPGVRFNIEEEYKNKKLTVTLGKEITGFSKSILDEINRNNYGFVFSSNEDLIYVYKARCLKKKEDNNYEEIYKTTTENYFVRYIQLLTNNKENKISKFFDKNNDSEYKEIMKFKNKVNAIYKEEDNFEFKDNELILGFGKEQKITQLKVVKG